MTECRRGSKSTIKADGAFHEGHCSDRRSVPLQGSKPEPQPRVVRVRGAGSHLCNGGLEAPATLAEKQRFRPQRSRGAGERNADRRIASGTERPVERNANVVALRQVDGAPVAITHAQPVVICALEPIAKVLRMHPLDRVGLSRFG